MKKITQKELNDALTLHKMWKMKFREGKQLILNDYDLCGLDFSFRDLQKVDMSGSKAYGANFMGCLFPHEKFMPEMYVSDSWGYDFHGTDARADKIFKRATA